MARKQVGIQYGKCPNCAGSGKGNMAGKCPMCEGRGKVPVRVPMTMPRAQQSMGPSDQPLPPQPDAEELY